MWGISYLLYIEYNVCLLSRLCGYITLYIGSREAGWVYNTVYREQGGCVGI